jgi:hypothetical protein
LQKIYLTYDIGQWVRHLKINDLTVGLSADNLFFFAPHWIGLDPETDQGVHRDAIPSIRTVNISLSAKF